MLGFKRGVFAYCGLLLIAISLLQVVLSPIQHNPVAFFLWSNFMLVGHQIFSGLAFIHVFVRRFNAKIFDADLWIIVTYLGLGLYFGLFGFGIGKFIWATLFVLLLVVFPSRKLDKFLVLYLSFLTIIVVSELWELPIYLKQAFFPPTPARYSASEIVSNFLLFNTKLWSFLLLFAWALNFKWKPSKLFFATLSLILLSYPLIMLTDLGWAAWYYRFALFPFALTFAWGFPKK